MNKPATWWHMFIQSCLFILALAGMLWNFSTSQQEQKDKIKAISDRVATLEEERKEDGLLYRADMNELKGTLKEQSQQLNDIRVLLENKKDRDK